MIAAMLPLLPPTNTASGASRSARASGARPATARTLSTPWGVLVQERDRGRGPPRRIFALEDQDVEVRDLGKGEHPHTLVRTPEVLTQPGAPAAVAVLDQMRGDPGRGVVGIGEYARTEGLASEHSAFACPFAYPSPHSPDIHPPAQTPTSRRYADHQITDRPSVLVAKPH